MRRVADIPICLFLGDLAAGVDAFELRLHAMRVDSARIVAEDGLTLGVRFEDREHTWTAVYDRKTGTFKELVWT